MDAATEVEGRKSEVESRTAKESKQLSRWQEISGITRENLHSLPEEEYRVGIEVLMEEVERLMLEELERTEYAGPRVTGARLEDWPRGFSRRGREACSRDGRTTKKARTHLWDPVRTVCRKLGISHAMLSHLSKEHSGMAAHEWGTGCGLKRLGGF
jgi:hypothetical protein